MFILDWIRNVAAAALSAEETAFATFDLACNCIDHEIAGDFVECGVFGGAQAAIMAKAIMFYSECYKVEPKRRVHLFDSFVGTPPTGKHDVEINSQVGSDAFRLQTACSIADVMCNMRQWGILDDLLVYHPGFFEDTLPVLEHFPIALLRLDADLYSSTKLCLDHLLPDVTPGGWVIVDDWDLSGARRAVLDYSVKKTGPMYWKQQPR